MTPSGDDALSALYLLGCLVLVGSALMVRRMPIAQGLKMAAAWGLIFGAAFVFFTLKDEFKALGTRLLSETSGNGQVAGDNQALRIRKSLDGHFWATASVNGTTVRFLIDSGATLTSLSAETARRAGVEPSGGMPVLVDTANGTVEAQRGRIGRLQIGDIERRDLAVHVAASFGDTDVLGMNFLSSLSSWGVEGDWLILKA